MGILNSSNIVNLHREMTMLKLKINVNLPRLLCIVISAAENDEFQRLVGFALTVTTRYKKETRVETTFRPLQRQADFHPEIRIARLPNRTPDKLKGRRFFSWHSIEDAFKIQVLTAE